MKLVLLRIATRGYFLLAAQRKNEHPTDIDFDNTTVRMQSEEECQSRAQRPPSMRILMLTFYILA